MLRLTLWVTVDYSDPTSETTKKMIDYYYYYSWCDLDIRGPAMLAISFHTDNDIFALRGEFDRSLVICTGCNLSDVPFVPVV